MHAKGSEKYVCILDEIKVSVLKKSERHNGRNVVIIAPPQRKNEDNFRNVNNVNKKGFLLYTETVF